MSHDSISHGMIHDGWSRFLALVTGLAFIMSGQMSH